MIDTLLETTALKGLLRAGWVRAGVPDPESVAAHSWGVAWLVLVLLPAHLDRGRALAYAVIHDLAEVRTGDIIPADRVPPADKRAAERRAMMALARSLPAHCLETWEAYERQEDPEARFVRQCDRLDMALQAVAYAGDGHPGMDTFLDSAAADIADPELRSMLHSLRIRWSAMAHPR